MKVNSIHFNTKSHFSAFLFFISISCFSQSYFPVQNEGNLKNLLQNFQERDDFRRKAVMMINYDETRKFTALHTILIYADGRSKFNFTDSAAIGLWQDSPLKGKVRESFKNAVLSGEKKSESIPFEYQYQFRSSPDQKNFLIYRFNYSQPALLVSFTVLDSTLKNKYKFELPVEDESVIHDIQITNQSKLLILTSESDNDFQLLQHDPASGSNSLLEVKSSDQYRRSFMTFQQNEDIIFVANICEENHGNLSGVMYSKFNFKTQKVEEIQFRSLTDEIKSKVNQPGTGFFEIVNFEINERGEALMKLEKQAILTNTYKYDPYRNNDPINWKLRKQKIQKGEKLVFEFYLDGKLVREEIVK